MLYCFIVFVICILGDESIQDHEVDVTFSNENNDKVNSNMISYTKKNAAIFERGNENSSNFQQMFFSSIRNFFTHSKHLIFMLLLLKLVFTLNFIFKNKL